MFPDTLLAEATATAEEFKLNIDLQLEAIAAGRIPAIQYLKTSNGLIKAFAELGRVVVESVSALPLLVLEREYRELGFDPRFIFPEFADRDQTYRLWITPPRTTRPRES